MCVSPNDLLNGPSLMQRLRAERQLLRILSVEDDENFEITVSVAHGRWRVTTRDRHPVNPAPTLEGSGRCFAEAWNAQRAIETDVEFGIDDIEF